MLNEDTLEKTRREQACEVLRTTRRKWSIFVTVDRYSTLLNQDEFWLRRAPYINVLMWNDQMRNEQPRAKHITETKASDKGNYLTKVDMGTGTFY